MRFLYPYLIKIQVLNSLAYRFEYFSAIGTNIFFLFGTVYLWKSVYQGIDRVARVGEEQMIVYAIMSVLMTALFQMSVSDTLFSRVREGQIAIDFIRPANLLGFWFAEDVGQSVSAMARFCVPVLTVSVLFVQAPLPADLSAGLLFIPSCLLSYVLLWQTSALVGLSAFWVTEFGNIGAIKNIMVVILSGQLIPLWLFPDVVQTISRFFPFQYTYQAPLEIYIGRILPGEAFRVMGIQGVWIGLFTLLLYGVWQRARKRVFVQGG